MSDLNLNEIQHRLNELFVTFRERKLIFWFDPKREFEEDIDNGSIQLKDAIIKKIEPDQQFMTKRFFEIEDTTNNYLVYAPFKRMSDSDENNHLLSILKYSSLFSADRISLVMSQLKIPSELHETMEEYSSFFGAKSRVAAFEKVNVNVKTKEELSITLMSILTKANTPQFHSIIQALFVEYSLGKDEMYRQLQKFGLLETFWKYIAKFYGYKNSEPTIQKLIICFYSNAFFGQLGQSKLPNNLKQYEVNDYVNAIVSFMDLFMNDSRYTETFDLLSDEVYRLIDGKKIIDNEPIEKLIDANIFEYIHQRFIIYYVGQLTSGDTTPMIGRKTVQEVITDKERAHFGQKYVFHYQAILNAQQLLSSPYTVNTRQFSETVKDYEEVSYLLDSYYRKFIWHLDRIEDKEAFVEVEKVVEKEYKKFLNEVSHIWNEQLYLNERGSMLDFYDQYADNKMKTVVIISDGLRYEAAKEIQETIQKEKKYTAKMATIFSVLPSVTEFGKAALLRSKNESFEYIDDFDVRVGDKKTSGTINRDKILKAKKANSLAISYKDVMTIGNAKDLRELFNGQEIIYLYHDQIDRTGDHGQEKQVFDAVQRTLDEIRTLLPRISNGANVYRFVITSDHGFIYTRSSVEEYEKVDNPSVDEQDRVERRFIISKHKYNEIGINSIKLGDVLRNKDERFVHYPESATIFKKKGGGQNYIHGGSSPQEMLVPILEVIVSRGASTKEPVSVQLMTAKRKIVGLSVSLEFYQSEAISDTIVKTQYQLYFEDESGNRVSNEHPYYADSSSTSASERFTSFTFDFVNRSYQATEKVYLVVKDGDTQISVQRIEFVVDNPFAGEFDFDL